jgi:pectin methylesterase-like acyl-CoA thioesterase
MDLSIKAAGALAADPDVAAKELPGFAATVRQAMTTVANGTPAANQVTVSPGGQTFPTIQAAIDSIQDAKLQKQYVVQIGPGTYEEVVTCKPWVFLQGAGSGQTIVTAAAVLNEMDKGTIRASSNSAIQNMSVRSAGASSGGWVTAVDCNGTVNFAIENCVLEANAGIAPDGATTNIVTVALDYSATGGGSQVNIAYCTIVGDGGTQPTGLVAYAKSFANVTSSKIIARNAQTSWGAAANASSAITLYNCVVAGTMSLMLPDSSAKITATDCTLDGPYSDGVIVINNAP